MGAFINVEKLPLSKVLKSVMENKKIRYLDILTGGDDYELLYTVNPSNIGRLDSESSVIGEIVKKSGIKVISKNSLALKFKKDEFGYKHF